MQETACFCQMVLQMWVYLYLIEQHAVAMPSAVLTSGMPRRSAVLTSRMVLRQIVGIYQTEQGPWLEKWLSVCLCGSAPGVCGCALRCVGACVCVSLPFSVSVIRCARANEADRSREEPALCEWEEGSGFRLVEDMPVVGRGSWVVGFCAGDAGRGSWVVGLGDLRGSMACACACVSNVSSVNGAEEEGGGAECGEALQSPARLHRVRGQALRKEATSVLHEGFNRVCLSCLCGFLREICVVSA
eukprot:1392254-Rhodomonas_salina.1